MEIKNLFMRTGSIIEKLNLFDDVDNYQDYINVLDISPHEVMEGWHTVIYNPISFDPLPRRTYSAATNYNQYRVMPNGKKVYKGDGMYVEHRIRRMSANHILSNPRPYWTDDYSHMKGNLTLCEDTTLYGAITSIV